MKLKRQIDKQLKKWAKSSIKEPLVIFGPRQVGKTFAAKEFSKKNYTTVHEINFWKNENYETAFLDNGKKVLDAKKIIKKLELLIERKIDPQKDLILFDEIQDCPLAYEALKFFKEDLPELAIIATGSYLNLFIDQKEEIKKYPVGSIKELFLKPLTFSEFLLNANTLLFERYQEINLHKDETVDKVLHQKLHEYLNFYYFTGGLPEVVQCFLNSYQESLQKAASESREKQNDLIRQYKNDLSKYSKSTDLKKIKKIFESTPLQLNQYQEDNVARFSFKEVSGKQGYRVLSSSFDYLSAYGLIIKSFIIQEPKHPLLPESKKESVSKFKVFFFDIGLLQAMLSVPFQNIIQTELGAYKGYLVENFIAQELYAKTNSDLFSYRSSQKTNSSEIEFILSKGENLVPLEAKSSAKYRKSKSLLAYLKKYKPKSAFKITAGNLAKNIDYYTVPTYLIEKCFDSEE